MTSKPKNHAHLTKAEKEQIQRLAAHVGDIMSLVPPHIGLGALEVVKTGFETNLYTALRQLLGDTAPLVSPGFLVSLARVSLKYGRNYAIDLYRQKGTTTDPPKGYELAPRESVIPSCVNYDHRLEVDEPAEELEPADNVVHLRQPAPEVVPETVEHPAALGERLFDEDQTRLSMICPNCGRPALSDKEPCDVCQGRSDV